MKLPRFVKFWLGTILGLILIFFVIVFQMWVYSLPIALSNVILFLEVTGAIAYLFEAWFS